jgi:hypothetical protein
MVFSVSDKEGVEVKGHFYGLPTIVQEEYREYIKKEYDITIEDLAADSDLRYLVSMVELSNLLEPLTHHQKALKFSEQLELF